MNDIKRCTKCGKALDPWGDCTGHCPTKVEIEKAKVLAETVKKEVLDMYYRSNPYDDSDFIGIIARKVRLDRTTVQAIIDASSKRK